MSRALALCLLVCRLDLSISIGAAPDAPTATRIIDQFSQLGVDRTAPRFGWVVNDADRGEKQTAYQVLVAINEAQLDNDQGSLWDSGKVLSSQQYGVRYTGLPLAKTTKYWWKVRTWNKNDQVSPWSATATFVTGFFQTSDWDPDARWIGNPGATSASNNPASLFRKTFQINKTVQQANLYICGLGQFVASVNGTRVGDHEIDPAWTDYLHSVNYVTFDVASLLQQGTNVLGIMLGAGWFSYGSPSTTGTYFYGTMRVLAQLHILYADGTSSNIVTELTWKTAASPFTYTEVFGLENYDARLEQPGWNTARFEDSAWSNTVAVAAPPGVLESQKCPPVVTHEVYATVSISNPASNVYVFDLGQNINGQHEITVHGPPGSTVEIVPGEWRDSNGRVIPIKNYTHSLYTLKGGGTEVWRLTFSTVGFRFIEIRNATRNLQQTSLPYIQDVKGYATYTAASEVGTFLASDNRYNQIHDLVLHTLQNNLGSIHTDCPTWEKLGWQEVVADTFPSSMCRFDLQTLLTKIAKDTREGQFNRALGYVPNIVPNWFLPISGEGGDYDNAPSWGTSAFQAPWMLYWTYGDTQPLQDSYATMKTYLAYLKTREINGVVNYGLGDYLAPAGPQIPNVEGAAYVLDTRLMRDCAAALGYTADATYYSNEFTRVQTAYNHAYFDSTNQWYWPMNQGNNAIPLAYGIVPAGKEQAVASALVQDIAEPQETTAYGGYYGSVLPYHATAGDVACTYLWRTLGRYGLADLVQTMILQPSAPSYLYMLNNGQTTLTENWNSLSSRSYDHDMYAGVFEWLYTFLGGISASKPGYEEIQLKPSFPFGLSNVVSSYVCVRGTIGSSWSLNNQIATWGIQVPANATAKVYIPMTTTNLWITEGGTTIWQNGAVSGSVPGVAFDHMEGAFPAWQTHLVWAVGSGSYQFQWPLFRSPDGLLARADNAQVRLKWNAFPNAASYDLKRSTVSGGPYAVIAGGLTTTNYSDLSVSNNSSYYYVVSARGPAGQTADSFEANATPRFIVTVTAGIAQVSLSWSAPPGAASYSVKRALVSGGPYTTVAAGLTVTNYTDTGLVSGTRYYYVVSGLNNANETSDSLEASASPHAILNPGFEQPVITGYQYNPVGGSWTFNGSCGISGNASGFTINNPNAPEGVQVAFLQGTGAISQSLNGLSEGVNYTVTFSAAQRNYPQAGQTFDLTLDGIVLASFAPLQTAITYVDYSVSFTTTAGNHILAFAGTNLKGGDNTILLDNVRLSTPPSTVIYAVNSGGNAVGTFSADANYSGGFVNGTTATVDTSMVTNPAPQAVYKTERAGNFAYTFTNLSSGLNYFVRLHFAELFKTGSGQRLFNVSINGTTVLTNFDIFAVAGGQNKAVIREFTVAANGSGQLVIQYISVADSAKSSGIEILQTTPAIPTERQLTFVLQGSTLHLSISSAPGWRYQLQQSDTLTPGSWINLGSPLAGTGGILNFTDTPQPGLNARFYRVMLEP